MSYPKLPLHYCAICHNGVGAEYGPMFGAGMSHGVGAVLCRECYPPIRLTEPHGFTAEAKTMIKPRLLKNWVICCNRPMEHLQDKPAYQCSQCSEVVTYAERLAMEGAVSAGPAPIDISPLLRAAAKENE